MVQAEGFSGADLAALLREAGLDVLRQLKSREALAGKEVYTAKGKGCRSRSIWCRKVLVIEIELEVVCGCVSCFQPTNLPVPFICRAFLPTRSRKRQ